MLNLEQVQREEAELGENESKRNSITYNYCTCI